MAEEIRWLNVTYDRRDGVQKVGKTYYLTLVDPTDPLVQRALRRESECFVVIDPSGLEFIAKIPIEVWRPDLQRIAPRTKQNAETVAQEQGANIIAELVWPYQRKQDKGHYFLYKEKWRGHVERYLPQSTNVPKN